MEAARSTPDDLARWYARPTVVAAAEAMLQADATQLDEVFASAPSRMPFDLALMRMLAAEIIGGPQAAGWLRAALETYEAAGAEPECARVRQMLRDAGAPVPRRRRPTGTVPAELDALGVTCREAEVLRLLGEGLSNAAIAARLYISVRTVETHVSSLLTKLQVDGRGQLTARSLAIDYAAGGGPDRLAPVVSRMCARARHRSWRHDFNRYHAPRTHRRPGRPAAVHGAARRRSTPVRCSPT